MFQKKRDGAVKVLLQPWPRATRSRAAAETVTEAGAEWLAVDMGAAVATLGALLALILGVSRTTLAMARDGHLPVWLSAVHPRFRVPHRAELAVGAVVALSAATTDLRGAIGFSSFGVLVYYAIAHVAALTLNRAQGRPPLLVCIVGLAGCFLASTLPPVSALTGAAVLLAGALLYATRRAVAARRVHELAHPAFHSLSKLGHSSGGNSACIFRE